MASDCAAIYVYFVLHCRRQHPVVIIARKYQLRKVFTKSSECRKHRGSSLRRDFDRSSFTLMPDDELVSLLTSAVAAEGSTFHPVTDQRRLLFINQPYRYLIVLVYTQRLQLTQIMFALAHASFDSWLSEQ